jgi:His/Glu/Gln/Arg/opine family amino acid ABC transporter permease subunit
MKGEAKQAPDVRGGTAPLPVATLAAGITSLALVVLGTAAVQVGYVFAGGTLNGSCKSVPGLFRLKPVGTKIVHKPIVGAEGVCHVVQGFQSGWETALLIAAVVIGGAALAVGFLRYRVMPSKRMKEQMIAGAVLGVQAVILSVLLFWFRTGALTTFVNNFFNMEALHGYYGAFVHGAVITLFLAFGGEVGGIIIGLTLSVFTLSSRRSVRAPARAYINFFRGTPLIWQLLFFYFGLAFAFKLSLSTLQTALIVFSLNTGAYSAEVFRAGIQSIERGQMEAARSLGMTYLQAMRYAIVPQGIRRVIPPLMNEFVILIKDTALITVLGLELSQRDILDVARSGVSDTFNGTFWIAAAAGYLIITLPLIRVVNSVEHRLRSGLTGIVGL